MFLGGKVPYYDNRKSTKLLSSVAASGTGRVIKGLRRTLKIASHTCSCGRAHGPPDVSMCSFIKQLVLFKWLQRDVPNTAWDSFKGVTFSTYLAEGVGWGREVHWRIFRLVILLVSEAWGTVCFASTVRNGLAVFMRCRVNDPRFVFITYKATQTTETSVQKHGSFYNMGQKGYDVFIEWFLIVSWFWADSDRWCTAEARPVVTC